MYGRRGHLGHVTRTIGTTFRSPILMSLHVKNLCSIGQVVSEEKMFENFDEPMMDGRRSHWYSNGPSTHVS